MTDDYLAQLRAKLPELRQGILQIPGGTGLELQTDEKHSFRSFAGRLDQRFQSLWPTLRTIAHLVGKDEHNSPRPVIRGRC